MELIALNDKSDHDFATNPFLCPAVPDLPALSPSALGVVSGDLPAIARLLALPDSRLFSPTQHGNI